MSERQKVKTLTKSKGEEAGWELVSSTGVAPRIFYFVYKAKGKKYELHAAVWYDRKRNAYPFGRLRLTVNNKKDYYFSSYEELAEFLTKRGIPLKGIEGIVTLWSTY